MKACKNVEHTYEYRLFVCLTKATIIRETHISRVKHTGTQIARNKRRYVRVKRLIEGGRGGAGGRSFVRNKYNEKNCWHFFSWLT